MAEIAFLKTGAIQFQAINTIPQQIYNNKTKISIECRFRSGYFFHFST